MRSINGVVTVLLTAKVAPYFNLAALGQDAFRFVRAQAANHVAHAFTAA